MSMSIINRQSVSKKALGAELHFELLFPLQKEVVNDQVLLLVVNPLQLKIAAIDSEFS